MFEAAASAFSSLVKSMEERIVAEVVGQAKTACRKYRSERWVYSAQLTGLMFCI